MPGLAEHQRAMLALVKGRPVAGAADDYYARLEPTKELALLREIAIWWRVLTIEGACPSTARLLRRLGLFEESVTAFYRAENVSPYIERASVHFLQHMQAHPDPLVRSMVRFEQALALLRSGDNGAFAIDWDRHPESVFAALDSGTPLPDAEAGAVHRLHLAEGRIDYERVA